MAASLRPSLIASALLALMLLSVATSGCTNPLGSSKPSVTMTAPYVSPTYTPRPISPTPLPTLSTTWNGMFVKLHGNVTAGPGEHVFGTVKVYYLDKNFWDDNPVAQYDTKDGGAYSLDVRAKVPFKVELGYIYVGQLPQVMVNKRLDRVFNIEEDTALDLNVMTANITPKN